MPLMRFTKKLDQVRDHRKTQTIRFPRKVPKNWKKRTVVWQEGDTLHVYILEKLGTAELTAIIPKKLRDITLEDAQKDGFASIAECQACIMEMHDCELDETVELLTFIPGWEKQQIVILEKSKAGLNSYFPLPGPVFDKSPVDLERRC